MKSAEEIFNQHTCNEMLGLMNKKVILEAMEEYASQFKTQSVTNEEIERMVEKELEKKFPFTYTNSVGSFNINEIQKSGRRLFKEGFDYFKTSILPLLQSKTEQTNPIK